MWIEYTTQMFLGLAQMQGHGIFLVLQETLGTPFLELIDPKTERDRVIIVKTDLDVLHDPTVPIDVMHCNIIIAISPLAGLAHAFQLSDRHQLGNSMTKV